MCSQFCKKKEKKKRKKAFLYLLFQTVEIGGLIPSGAVRKIQRVANVAAAHADTHPYMKRQTHYYTITPPTE